MKNLSDLYIELRDPLFKYLFFLSGDADLAEELTQETFCQALISLKGFRGNSTFKTWLYAIARNTYLKSQKKHNKNLFVEFDENVMKDESQQEPGPLYNLLQKEREHIFNKLLKELPENYRTVLALKEYEQWRYKELAQVMGKTENWVRVTYFRAKQQLKEKYNRYEGGDCSEN